MAAAKPNQDHAVVVIGYPATTPYGRHGREGSVAQAERPASRRKARDVACYILTALAFCATIVTAVVIIIEFPEEQPKYSAAVTAVAGLDPARDLSARGRPALSPVFNVTVQIDNRRNAVHENCIPNLVTAQVSFGDAFLAKGTVPPFCARRRREGECVARAWGEDVVVPWFLRDELAGKLAAGEAAVEVQLMPWAIVCRAKIGGGLSRCRDE